MALDILHLECHFELVTSLLINAHEIVLRLSSALLLHVHLIGLLLQSEVFISLILPAVSG